MAGGYSPTTFTATLSSSGTSAIQLEPTARVTTVMVYNSTTAAQGIVSTSTQPVQALYYVEGTLDVWTPAGVTQTWQALSSIAYTVNSTSSSSVVASSFESVFLSILGPLAGVRLNSTGWFSASHTGGLTLKALQSVTAGP